MTLSNHHASYMYWQIEVIGHLILLLDQCFFLIIILSSNYFALVSIIFVHWLQLIYFFTFCLSIDFNSIKNEITHYGVESVPKIIIYEIAHICETIHNFYVTQFTRHTRVDI